MNFTSNFSALWQSVQNIGNGFLSLLPRLVLAALLFGIFVLIASGVRGIVRRHAATGHRHRSLELALGRLAHAGVLLLGLLIALTSAFPSVTPASLVQLLGIGTVAIGFAFKDILQNYLAGILILLTEPFRVGDQIVFQNFEGTVEHIQTRATFLKMYDGRRVVLPNSDLYTNAVTVNTAFDTRRLQYDVGIGYGDDIGRAAALILQAMKETDGVCETPKPDVLLVDLAASTVNLRARWWADPRRAESLDIQSRVLRTIKESLTANGIDLPFPTQQLLLHDQTERTDGDRARQREGWPAGKGDVPGPRSIAGAIAGVSTDGKGTDGKGADETGVAAAGADGNRTNRGSTGEG